MHRLKTVLIVEDEAEIRNFISRVLELEGYRVLTADDGKTGMNLVQEEGIDLLLLDLRLPGRDGWSVLREIKRRPGLADIPVIVFTALAEAVQRKKTLRMGAARYLVKPLSAQHLSQTIAAVLDEKETQYQAAGQKAAGYHE
jgi:CRP/FNR family cyclic AMP-dependent transcriptional regulator